MATDFTKEQYAGVYKSSYNFASRYYGIDNLFAGGAVNLVYSNHSIQFIYLMYRNREND